MQSCLANSRDKVLPIPEPAPVIAATLSLKFFILFPFFFSDRSFLSEG
ncbi:hypothetical protein LEP1GSC061_4168 [Leptospira wolffii serovar Khorat str. Khorat-H2]|nr:hypothetical protein LEP1GSC061_4168 [Leptospira wolffii serovar Khorat str. Khorat-H2]